MTDNTKTRKVIDGGNRWFVIEDRFRNRQPEVHERAKHVPDDRALLAMEMATKWGMVAGAPDGEDSSGRAKLALLSPSEVAARAVETADLLWAAIADRGWLHDVPHPDTLVLNDEEDVQ